MCLASRTGKPADAPAAVVPAQRARHGRPSPASERRPGAVAPRSHASTPRSPHLSRRRCGRVAQARRTRGTRRGIRGGTRAPRIKAQLRCSTRVPGIRHGLSPQDSLACICDWLLAAGQATGARSRLARLRVAARPLQGDVRVQETSEPGVASGAMSMSSGGVALA